MLVIRREQLAVFETAAMVAFENELLEHLRKFAPELYEIRGRDTFLRVIRDGVARAWAYGFTNRGPLRLFIELMLCFGVDFDSDPQYPWAALALRDASVVDQMRRADALFRAAELYSAAVVGPQSRYAIAAARSVRAATFGLPLQSESDLEFEIVRGFARLYPEKYEYLGESSLHALVRGAFDRARQHELVSARAVALLSGLMFGFGHGVLEDPLYPWIGSTLLDPQKEEEHRVHRCYSKTMTYLDRIHERMGG